MFRTAILVAFLLIAPSVFAETITLSGNPGGAYILNTGTVSLQAFCLDYNKLANIGVPLEYTSTSAKLSNFADIARIAWITQQVNYTEAIRQNAIWAITNGFIPVNSDSYSLVSNSLNYLNYDLTGFKVWTANDTKGQPFLTKDPAPVPEPTTLVLLGSGLLGIAQLTRKRRKGA